VVNDGSTDTTAEVLAEYGDAIRVLTQPNGGPSSTRNLGISEAKGDFPSGLALIYNLVNRVT
jgi:glycosyltransferase involved in cell wall biosynthesis